MGERFRLPRLRNRELIVSILQNRYPRRLAFRGLSSAATLRLSIDARGRVDPLSVKVVAFDREEFALLVMDVARRFRFAPAHYRGENVPIIIDIPVEWKARP
jgi:TonB family protein